MCRTVTKSSIRRTICGDKTVETLTDAPHWRVAAQNDLRTTYLLCVYRKTQMEKAQWRLSLELSRNVDTHLLRASVVCFLHK